MNLKSFETVNSTAKAIKDVLNQSLVSNDYYTDKSTVSAFTNGTELTFSAQPTDSTNASIYPKREIDIGMSIPVTVLNFYLVLATWKYYFKHSQDSILWTNRLCFFSALILFTNSCWFQTEIQLQSVSTFFCRAYGIVNLLLSVGTRTLVYTVLWIRQRYFYKAFALFKVSMAKFNCVSKSLLAGIIIFPILQIGALAALPSYASEVGCKSGPETPSQFLQIATPIVFVLVSLFQVRNCNLFLKLSNGHKHDIYLV